MSYYGPQPTLPVPLFQNPPLVSGLNLPPSYVRPREIAGIPEPWSPPQVRWDREPQPAPVIPTFVHPDPPRIFDPYEFGPPSRHVDVNGIIAENIRQRAMWYLGSE